MRRHPFAWVAPFAAGMGLFGWLMFTGPLPHTGPPAAAHVYYFPLILRSYADLSDPFTRLNFYRLLADLPPLARAEAWQAGTAAHARYIVQQDPDKFTTLDFENPGSAGFSAEGAEAARNSLILGVQHTASFLDTQAVDYWARSPFQMLSLLDPELLQTSLGTYREAGPGYQMAAVLDVRRGLGSIPDDVHFPVMWPGDGQAVPLRSYSGSDYPNPLRHPACANLNPTSAGLPIILQVDDGGAAISGLTTALAQGAAPVPHCAFGPHDYASADPQEQALGRALLDARDAIVLIPQAALLPGATYSVSITAVVNGSANTYAWSFRVEVGATP